MIELHSIDKQAQESGRTLHILLNLDLIIAQGDFLTIMGPSGSGKSTLLNILGLLDSPTSGEYSFEGTNVSQLRGHTLAEFRNRRIGFVFQAFMLIPRLTVRENVEVPLLYTRCSSKVRHQRIEAALDQVGLLSKAQEPIINLSGGQKQRVAIARSIINDPDLVLADEPSGNLDVESKAEVLRIFQELHRRGKTIVLVTHDSEVAALGTRLLTLRGGQWADPAGSLASGVMG